MAKNSESDVESLAKQVKELTAKVEALESGTKQKKRVTHHVNQANMLFLLKKSIVKSKKKTQMLQWVKYLKLYLKCGKKKTIKEISIRYTNYEIQRYY